MDVGSLGSQAMSQGWSIYIRGCITRTKYCAECSQCMFMRFFNGGEFNPAILSQLIANHKCDKLKIENC